MSLSPGSAIDRWRRETGSPSRSVVSLRIGDRQVENLGDPTFDGAGQIAWRLPDSEPGQWSCSLRPWVHDLFLSGVTRRWQPDRRCPAPYPERGRLRRVGEMGGKYPRPVGQAGFVRFLPQDLTLYISALPHRAAFAAQRLMLLLLLCNPRKLILIDFVFRSI